jgi:hypothetical protein
MSATRLALLLPLFALACGGASGPGDPGSPVASAGIPGAPATPAPAPFDPNPPAAGGSGSNRFQIGAATGLYLVDPAKGEPAVQGLVVVTFGPVGTGNFIPPNDTVVTMNGVPLLRDPNLNGAYWRVDPAGPQPQIGSGGRIVLVATATVNSAPIERTLVLPCPSDVEVGSTPGVGSAISAGSSLHLSTTADLTLNTGIVIMASNLPEATLYGYDPATRAITGVQSPELLPPGPLALTVPVAATAAPAYLLDLRWPGHWVIDGETGGFCGLAKRLTYTK